MIRFILSAVFLFFLSNSYAQDQWLVTAKLDTIRGKIFLDYGGPYQADEAQVKIGKEKSSYKAYQVRSVSLGENDVYESIKIDQRYQFAKVDVKGKYFTQYLYIDATAGNTSNYSLKLFVNWKGDMYKISNLTPRKRFAMFFEDCESVKTKIESGELKKKDLKKIFEAFDECMDQALEAKSVATVQVATPSADMSEFIEKLKSMELYNDDLENMIKDISQKMVNKQSIPQYLQQAVLGQLGEDENLKSMFLELIN
ncbi:hypothetical protein [Reichenbachiella sp.]|uniref:hypothetical protein n=1 Tax=Reichenbachiella sp. TaxID=2184521 RepID=UPI0032987DA5